MNSINSSLNQKYELKEKLKSVLQETVEREVVVQAEGVLAPPEREKAKSIASSQQKLERVIKRQEESYQSKVRLYCERCQGKNEDSKTYCSYCPETSLCAK